MSEFRFRLQSVVQLRERERDQAAQAYEKATLAQQQLDDEIQRRQQDHDAQQPLQTTDDQQVVDPQRIIESQRYQLVLLQEIAELRTKRQLVDTECERRRQVLVAHEQRVRSLEKLKDKQAADWQAREARGEQIALDQWAGFQYWHNNRPPAPSSTESAPNRSQFRSE